MTAGEKERERGKEKKERKKRQKVRTRHSAYCKGRQLTNTRKKEE